MRGSALPLFPLLQTPRFTSAGSAFLKEQRTHWQLSVIPAPILFLENPMALNILIIGGVALGTKAATRARRIMPDANITLIDQGTYISYGGCGIPYFVGGEVSSVRGLRTTGANVIRDEAFFDDL